MAYFLHNYKCLIQVKHNKHTLTVPNVIRFLHVCNCLLRNHHMYCIRKCNGQTMNNEQKSVVLFLKVVLLLYVKHKKHI